MEAAGVIRGYTALVDREKVGPARGGVAEVNLDRHSEDAGAALRAGGRGQPADRALRSATGQADYMLKVLVPDIKHYERFLHETLFKLPGVTHVRSSIVLREVKSEVALPIEQGRSRPRRRAGGGAEGARACARHRALCPH